MSQQSRAHKQGRYVEYDNKPGQYLYGSDEIAAQPLLTPFVVGKDSEDPYSRIAPAVADAGEAANVDNWKWVFVKPGQYLDEGTVELPPYVIVTTNFAFQDYYGQYPERNVAMQGGFTVSTDGPRGIFGLDIWRESTDLDVCILLDVPSSARLLLQGCNVLHDGNAGCIVARGGGGASLADVWLFNSFAWMFNLIGSANNPVLWADSGGEIGLFESRVICRELSASDRVALTSGTGWLAVSRTLMNGILEAGGTGVLTLNECSSSSQQGPALLVTGAGNPAARFIDPPQLTGTGAWDVDGTGIIEGCGGIWRVGTSRLLINLGTLTMNDGGGFLTYVPVNPADWPIPLGGVPTDVLDALDIIASRLALLGG